jgi:hypothetical protein
VRALACSAARARLRVLSSPAPRCCWRCLLLPAGPVLTPRPHTRLQVLAGGGGAPTVSWARRCLSRASLAWLALVLTLCALSHTRTFTHARAHHPPRSFSRGIEARKQLLADLEELSRAREAREQQAQQAPPATGAPVGRQPAAAAAGAAPLKLRRSIFDYVLDQQRPAVRARVCVAPVCGVVMAAAVSVMWHWCTTWCGACAGAACARLEKGFLCSSLLQAVRTQHLECHLNTGTLGAERNIAVISAWHTTRLLGM